MSIETSPPFPTPITAVWLTLGSWLAVEFLTLLLAPGLGPVAALGIALVIGLGTTATLAAQRVPPPEAERIGLQAFPARLLLPILLLVPLVLLTSEIDNWIRTLLSLAPAFPTEPSAEEVATRSALPLLELAIVRVGIAPVLEEFFFRGVLLQGLVANGGVARGIVAAAMLGALGQSGLAGPQGFPSALVMAIVTGLVLGLTRVAAGSVLAPILLSMAMMGAGLSALAIEAELPIPGFNAPGDHTPLVWLIPAATSVAIGLALLERERRRLLPAKAGES